MRSERDTQKGYTVRKVRRLKVLSRNMDKDNGLEIIKYESDLCLKMID